MIVVDASALFKLMIIENHSEFVTQIFYKETGAGEPIIIPDLAVSEVLNILWVDYNLKKTIDKDTFDMAVIKFDKIVENLDILPAKSLKDMALKLSVSKNISIYDSMYLASSVSRGAPLMSFDRKMCEKASELGVLVITKG